MIKRNLAPIVNFTQHAFIRAEERITLGIKDILQIIKWEKFVSIGMEKNTNREHRLFYSNPDSQCFVLIQDIKTNTVITILPLDYHESISWAVSLEFQKEAKELILGKTVSKSLAQEKAEITQVNEIIPHKFFHVSCDVLDKYLQYSSSTKLGKFASSDYDNKIEKLIVSDVFVIDILEKIDLITKDTEYQVNEIMIKKKSKDISPTFVELATLNII
jgi:hypothetical protein